MAERREVIIVTSTMGIAETTKLDGELQPDDAAKISAYFKHRFIVVRQVDRRTAEDAAEIARNFGLKPADAIHVATALLHEVPLFQTRDGKLLKKDGQIGDPPLAIRQPSIQVDLDSRQSDMIEEAEGLTNDSEESP